VFPAARPDQAVRISRTGTGEHAGVFLVHQHPPGDDRQHLVLVGLWTRPVALLLSGEMAVAFWYVHIQRGWFPYNNGGSLVILYCFVFLYIVFAGPGPWSLDAARGAESRTAAA
jgi:putative oxidoreductase